MMFRSSPLFLFPLIQEEGVTLGHRRGGVFDTLVEHAVEHLGKGFANAVNIPQGQGGVA